MHASALSYWSVRQPVTDSSWSMRQHERLNHPDPWVKLKFLIYPDPCVNSRYWFILIQASTPSNWFMRQPEVTDPSWSMRQLRVTDSSWSKHQPRVTDTCVYQFLIYLDLCVNPELLIHETTWSYWFILIHGSTSSYWSMRQPQASDTSRCMY
jgi:hypothetical protein